ncbi:DUF2272 domain-containing protein [Pseudoxanthomonas sp. PXM02]|uniref:DUF2272 domain-containing protein n=1 Tax=Pseudoxanthomonas sp. PXM02 TaxID=2769294 RepID=UPI00178141B6|nr:DUF2272 domain-containing protein [Pseudoxanthomonas sp. PXM02]MBD9480359.1 DUF2272 domain-containing protein [Pseudoxanthomonas sp. PXM02]
MKPTLLLLFALAALLCALPAHATDPCPQLRTRLASTDVATRIAAIACQENHAWFRSFIDADGRAGGQAVYEAENDALADGAQAWRKVAMYWNGSGLGSGCGTAGVACRSFVVDTPWSAAFVSWVMRQARVPGFTVSSRHVDYVRAAARSGSGPYRLVAPQAAAPAPGDMLCYVRGQSRALGHAGLLNVLDAGGAGLPMHCDIVVAAQAGIAWLVGGNVQQTVALRMLRLDEAGRFADLPTRNTGDAPCSPDVPAHCNLNRQDWAALLKLTADAPASLLAASP